MCFFDKKVKTQQQQSKKWNIKTLAESGDWTRELLHPKRMRYHCTTESTDGIDCSKVILLFRRNGSKRKKKQSEICGPDIFNKCIFFCNIFTYKNSYIWQFLIFTVSLLKYCSNVRCKQFWPKRYRPSIFK